MIRLLLALTLAAAPAVAAEPAAEHTWDLTPVFASDDAWQQALTAFRARLDDLTPFRGKLKKELPAALEVWFSLDRDLNKLYGYASMRSDLDTRAPGPQGMEQAVRGLAAELSAKNAWFEPELLTIPAGPLARFRKSAEVAPYLRYLDRLEKRRPHVLDADGERLLGLAGGALGTSATIGGLLRDGEIPWPTIKLADGRSLRIDATGYGQGRSSSVRADRVATYKAFYATLDAHEGSLATALAGTVQEHLFLARARGYDSALQAALAANEVDPAVYDMLIREIDTGLPTLHRYLKLRARLLGVSDLAYHDLYPSLLPGVSTAYDYDTSKRLTLEAVAVLGQDYVDALKHALDHRWVDVFPGPGKRTGAYVTDPFYGIHPYMLLNHTDDYQGLTTLAHEAGHLMHSHFSQTTQPYPTSGYSIFVAEVASTVNEVLLFEHLLKGAPDDKARLALLGQFLEGMRTTVYRQTMFATFERDIHAAAEAGEPLSADKLDAAYLALLRRYHGHDLGVTTIDDAYASEWAFIPHFHYDFYVYQYATSYIAAIALARGILDGEPGAVERYRTFLASGSTKPPVELLAAAGVDMTKPEPMRAAVAYMSDVITRIEALTQGK